MVDRPKIAIVGAGSLANFLAPALRRAGYSITEIIARLSSASRHKSALLGRKVQAQVATARTARFDADVLWFCVPDREIQAAALALTQPTIGSVRFAFHSSGARSSRELDALRKMGIAAASVHPLMTFVAGARPALQGVPFAVEGDPRAVRLARQIARDLGGEAFPIPAARKAAYHAWATMTCPLLVAFLVTLEDAATLAGLTRGESRTMSLPIIHQTLENYSRLGPRRSFSGPLRRGDIETVARHLRVIGANPGLREVYVALARSAIRRLPIKNRKELLRIVGK